MFLQKLIGWLQVSWDVSRFERKEKRRVKEYFYPNSRFADVDCALRRAYIFRNPYSISRKFWGEHCYGETPLSSLETIGKRMAITPLDQFVDLGAGRGRGVFFIHYRFGCKATGIEQIPVFVATAKRIQEKKQVEGVLFTEKDLSEADLNVGNVFYLAWTCFSEDHVELLTQRLEALPAGIRMATVSFPIPSEQFTCLDSFSAPFAWGNGEIFIQQKMR